MGDERKKKKGRREEKKIVRKRQLTQMARVKPCQTHKGQKCQHEKKKRKKIEKGKVKVSMLHGCSKHKSKRF